MSFSVLISLYSKEHPEYLKSSLDSIFNQSQTPDEVVLVEDGPLTEGLYEVVGEFVRKYPSLKIVKLPKNVGLGRALNEGLKHCHYDLVARMDTDDISKSYRFEKQLKVFERYPQVDVVSSWIDEFKNDPNHIIATRKLPEFSFEIFKYGKKRCPINHPVVMFRKNTILFAGGYRPFPLFEDYSLWVRLLLNGAKFYNVQESLLLFRTSSDMYKRRGGFKHAINEVRFQRHIHRLGYITWPCFLFNVSVRFVTRIVPNNLRAWIYRTLLR